MNKKIIASAFVFAVLVGFAAFINFNAPAEAAYLQGDIPGTQNYTLRYNNGAWEQSGALTNAGDDVVVTGDITAESFIYESDARLKENIAQLNNSLDKVQALRGVSFDWKSSGEPEVGLIAQEVENVIPELVITNSEGIKGVKYGNIVALLIEAVKEQQAEIDSLKVEIENLK